MAQQHQQMHALLPPGHAQKAQRAQHQLVSSPGELCLTSAACTASFWLAVVTGYPATSYSSNRLHAANQHILLLLLLPQKHTRSKTS
jgi:hypothetical protein